MAFGSRVVFGDSDKTKRTSDLRPECTTEKQNRRRLTACGGQVGAPHELFARPPLSPLFHLYTLAPLCLRHHSGHSRNAPLLDLSRTRETARHAGRLHSTRPVGAE